MNKYVKLQLKQGYSVILLTVSEGIYAFIEHASNKKSWKGLIEDISFKAYLSMETYPSWIARKLFINEKTLELQIMRGLLGSGSHPSKQKMFEMKRNSLFWEKSLLLKNPQIDLEIIEKTYETICNNEVLTYSKGKIKNEKNCYIRTYTSSAEKVNHLASRELRIIRELKDLGIRVNTLGYYIIEENNQLSYHLVSELLPVTLSKMVNEPVAVRLNLISTLIKLVYKMNCLGINYILLNPTTIFLDEHELILGDTFLANRYEIHQNIDDFCRIFRLAEKRFFPVEHPCVTKNPNKLYRGKLNIADYSSLVHIVSYLFINESASLPLFHLNNKSSINLKHKTIKKCLLFEQTKNLKLVELICRILTKEIDLKKLNYGFNPNEIDCFITNTFDNSVISLIEFKDILKRFQQLQNELNCLKHKTKIEFSLSLKNKCKEFFNEKKKHLKMENSTF